VVRVPPIWPALTMPAFMPSGCLARQGGAPPVAGPENPTVARCASAVDIRLSSQPKCMASIPSAATRTPWPAPAAPAFRPSPGGAPIHGCCAADPRRATRNCRRDSRGRPAPTALYARVNERRAGGPSAPARAPVRDSQHRQPRSGSKFARTKSAWKSLAGDRGCLFQADAVDKRVSMPLHQRQRPRRDGVRLIKLRLAWLRAQKAKARARRG
jgi:hypothetical protein